MCKKVLQKYLKTENNKMFKKFMMKRVYRSV